MVAEARHEIADRETYKNWRDFLGTSIPCRLAGLAFYFLPSQRAKMDRASQPASQRRFAITGNIVLLHEVVALNPPRDAMQWTVVVDNLSKATGRSFKVCAARDRCDLLLGHFHREDWINKRVSYFSKYYCRLKKAMCIANFIHISP